jgi:hypothetical protein
MHQYTSVASLRRVVIIIRNLRSPSFGIAGRLPSDWVVAITGLRRPFQKLMIFSLI